MLTPCWPLYTQASMPGVMESVPWPITFTSFASPFTVLSNVDVIGVIAFDSCALSLRFPQKFLVQMSLPLFLGLTSYVAYRLANCLSKKQKKTDKHHRKAQTTKILILIIMTVYPGLCTGVFTMFRKFVWAHFVWAHFVWAQVV